MIVYSLATIPERINNLDIIIPSILNQCDLLYVNLVNYTTIPSILNNNKIKINQFTNVGSEIRFYNYNEINNKSYYLTIDDDILYPDNYSDIMISSMKKYNNEALMCVHGSVIDKKLNRNYYLRNRQVLHFTSNLSNDTIVMIPGVGTSCFYKENMSIDLDNYTQKNMSDVFTGCFLAEQNVSRISVKRPKNWLMPLNEYNKRIFGNNPHQDIDRMINTYKEIL